MADVVLYAAPTGRSPASRMNRPEYGNAQNSAMTYALDDAFYAAAADDEVKVIILAGEGKHFSAGHDIGTPGRDIGTVVPAPGGPVVGSRRQGRRRRAGSPARKRSTSGCAGAGANCPSR